MQRPMTEARKPVWLGEVTGMSGPWLTGWVTGPAKASPPRIVARSAGGVKLGEALPTRPVTRSVPAGCQGLSFRLKLLLPDTPGQVRVFAGKQELTGSPLPAGPHCWDGALSLGGGYAEGWVMARAPSFIPPEIRIFDQTGRVLVSCTSRPPADRTLPFQPARFRLRLPDEIFRNAWLHASAVADGQVFAVANLDTRFNANLDSLTGVACTGWVYAPADPQRRFTVEILRDGEAVAEAMAHQRRDDVSDVTGMPIACGFRAELPPPAVTEAAHEITLRIARTDCQPFGGPFVVGRQYALIPALHRALAAARQGGLDGVALACLRDAVATQAGAWRADPARETRLELPRVSLAPARLTVIIPVYRDVGLTRACIESVLAHRDPRRDAVLLINDASPEPDMAPLLAGYEATPNLLLLTNPENLGFVGSINRGLAFAREGHVLLLNSDTEVFAGGLDALVRAAESEPGIGTITPLSNAATMFSYPVPDQASLRLHDIDFADLAAIALERNAGLTFDVPTGHGFCLLVTRAARAELGGFDSEFGRGYGEENDFCRRAADRGLRNLAVADAFVAHRESISFTKDKSELLSRNLALLESRYPEYAAEVRVAFARDVLRAARWNLDAARLEAARGRGLRHWLAVRNWLGGGTRQAIADIDLLGPHDGAERLDLCAQPGGGFVLRGFDPRFRAVFAETESEALFRLLSEADIVAVDVHQLLGFPAEFVTMLREFVAHRRCRFFVHDFYTLCPRVTLIDANGRFCGAPEAAVCDRCLSLGGTHEADRLQGLTVGRQRALMGEFLRVAGEVVAPSASAALHARQVFGDIHFTVSPHHEPPSGFQVSVRDGDPHTIVLLGAIGPHKGADCLAAVARQARLAAPDLRFVVIGHTSCDEILREFGNVRVTGAYHPFELGERIAAANARMALFLHQWPETYSYTLSEAVRHGLVPLVPDIGAPAERVRAAGFGHVFPFPIEPAQLVALLDAFATGARLLVPPGAEPARFARA